MKRDPRVTKYKLPDELIKISVGMIAQELFNYCRRAGKHFLIIGLSGGADSAVATALALIAAELSTEDFGLYVVAKTLPCLSKKEDFERAEVMINAFKGPRLKWSHKDLTKDYFHYFERTEKFSDPNIVEILKETGKDEITPWLKDPKANRICRGNIIARLRMIELRDTTAKLDGLLIATGNLSEAVCGFWTIAGDEGDLNPLAGIFKGLELYDFAHYLGIPDVIIKAIPDDGLGVTDEGDDGQLPGTYPIRDHILISLTQQGFDIDGDNKQLDSLPEVKGFEPELVCEVATCFLKAKFKRKFNFPGFSLSRPMIGLPSIREIKL